MSVDVDRVLDRTESVCPECLVRVPALRVARGRDIYLRKECPEHGLFEAILWRGEPAFETWVRPKISGPPESPLTSIEGGCPYDCGLCPDHRQQPCCVLIEVTQRCDLGCRVCFADAGARPTADAAIPVIGAWYRRLLDAGGPYNIQLSGGEPCVRDDLPEIIALGRSLGFPFFQVNTNGLRLAGDPTYVKALKQAGLSTVFLQFDGTRDEIHERLRGIALLGHKMQAIAHCAENDLGVVLVPTLVPGVNTDDIGRIVELAFRLLPTVRGVHFQPISYFGRFPQPPRDEDRITIPEVLRSIEVQTGGRIRSTSFRPCSGENAHCSFHGSFVLMPDGMVIAVTKHDAEKSCCAKPEHANEGARKAKEVVAKRWSSPGEAEPPAADGPGLGIWDTFLARARTHALAISGMAFQDAWTLDLDRLRECDVMTVSVDGLLVPFCAYNLTGTRGQSLYRTGGRVT